MTSPVVTIIIAVIIFICILGVLLLLKPVFLMWQTSDGRYTSKTNTILAVGLALLATFLIVGIIFIIKEYKKRE